MTNNTVKLPKKIGIGANEGPLLFTFVNGVEYDSDFFTTISLDCKVNGIKDFSIEAHSLKKLGFTNFERHNDSSFIATLPENWTVVYKDDHHYGIFDAQKRMRIYIVDDIDNGFCGLIFTRYSLSTNDKSVYITDSTEHIELVEEVSENDYLNYYFDEGEDYFEGYLITTGYAQLKKKYPEWCNPFAYWD